MKILITGALGNLGIICVEEALSRGFQVRCFDLDTPRNQYIADKLRRRYVSAKGYVAAINSSTENGTALEFVWGDISQITLNNSLLSDIDGVIHNACILPPNTETHPDLAYAVNVEGTRRLIRLAERQPGKLRFIYPSSVTVFGPPRSGHTRMQCGDPTIASDQYTQHKLLCEADLKKSSLEWVIFRVGVSVDCRTTKTDLKTLKQLLNTDPDNPLEYVHPKDVAYAMCEANSNGKAPQKTLLIGGGKPCQVTQRDFLNAALEGCGLHLSKSSFGKAPYYTHWMDTGESQQLLKYQRHTFEHYRKEMADTFKTTRRLLTPIRPIANWFLNRVAQRMTAR